MTAECILVISHRRSGTHWTIDTVRNNFASTSRTFLTLERLLPWHKDSVSLDKFQSLLASQNGIPIIKTHLLPTLGAFTQEPVLEGFVQSLLDKSKIVYVYRDGRDVLVSLYHYAKKFNPEIGQISFSDFIRMDDEGGRGRENGVRVDRMEYWRRHVEGWLARPDVFGLQYENLHSNYEESVANIGDFLGLELQSNIKRIELPKYGNRSSTTGRIVAKAMDMLRPVLSPKRLGRSSAVLPRKGVVGDWRQYFSDEDLLLFDTVAGELMRKLGYCSPEDLHAELL